MVLHVIQKKFRFGDIVAKRSFTVKPKHSGRVKVLLSKIDTTCQALFVADGSAAALHKLTTMLATTIRHAGLCSPKHTFTAKEVASGGDIRAQQFTSASQRATSHKRTTKSRKQAGRAKRMASVGKPKEAAVTSFIQYLHLRDLAGEGSRFPANCNKLQEDIITQYHFCANDRAADKTAFRFATLGNQHLQLSSVDKFCNSVLIAMLPKWTAFESFVTACFGQPVFRIKALHHTKQTLIAKLDEAARMHQMIYKDGIWANWPYITFTESGNRRVRQLAALMLSLKEHADVIVQRLSTCSDPDAYIARITEQFRGIGSFIAYQVCLSWISIDPTCQYDPEAHCIAGNGCVKGLKEFFPAMTLKGNSAAQHQLRLKAVQAVHQAARKKRRSLTLQNTEHCLCEYAKFVAIHRWKSGKLKVIPRLRKRRSRK